MDLLDRGRRRIREHRARRMRARARHGDPGSIDTDTVDALRDLAETDDAGARLHAVDGLAALARAGSSSDARRRATDALVGLLAGDDEGVATVAADPLGYVGLERPGTHDRLDPAYARVLAQYDHAAHRRVAVDVAAIAVRHDRGGRDPLPGARRTLRECLLGGPRSVRVNAATAYVVVADRPEVVDDPGTVAEYLAILAGELDRAVPPPDSQARRIADGRTLREAIDRLAGSGR